MGVVPRVCTFYHPALRGGKRGRRALPGDLREQAALLQPLSGGLRVIAAVEVDARPPQLILRESRPPHREFPATVASRDGWPGR